MRLYTNWKRILRKAWSIRFNAIGAVFAGLLVVFPMWADTMSRTTFAASYLAISIAAGVARVVFQEEV